MTKAKAILLTKISDFPANKTFVLDGGFGSLLESLGYSVNNHELWSGGANIDNPDIVLEAHKQFIRAGAEIVMTNTYHCSVQKMIDAKFYTQKQAEHVIKEAVDIARRAILESDAASSTVLVGSVGPYATYLRDGSEYSGSYTKQLGFNTQTIVDYYLQQSRPLLEAGIECLVFETIPTLVEVECVGEALQRLAVDHPGLCAWISVTCQDESTTRSGDDFADVLRVASGFPRVQCVGLNCTSPLHVTALLERAFTKLEYGARRPHLVVYPNSGEVYSTVMRSFEGDTRIELIAELIPRWHALGARVVGGCCRVLPRHIAQIADSCAKLNDVKNSNF